MFGLLMDYFFFINIDPMVSTIIFIGKLILNTKTLELRSQIIHLYMSQKWIYTQILTIVGMY